MRDVHFSYDGRREILKGVDMDFPAGSFTSLVGTSGCGKSTVAGILMGRNKGFYGSVEVSGHALQDLSEASLMANMTCVTNKSYLFKGTVRDNLCLGNPNASTADMHRALVQVNLDGFLAAQDGLETEIAEEGSNLSGGQRQRLSIARALLHDTPGYIFDEATSNIDVESEEVIMEVIHELAKTKTVILISHRLANVVDSDCIYMLEGGHIAEHGTHGELMANDGPYRSLFEQQRALEQFADASSGSTSCHPERSAKRGVEGSHAASDGSPACHPERSAERGVEGSHAASDGSPACHPERSAERSTSCHPERSAKRGVEGSHAASDGEQSATEGGVM